MTPATLLAAECPLRLGVACHARGLCRHARLGDKLICLRRDTPLPGGARLTQTQGMLEAVSRPAERGGWA